MKTHLKINVRELLAFFDVKSPHSRGHMSAISGVIGEDLGISLLQRCLRKEHRISSRVILNNGIPKTPTRGTRDGHRLDRWLLEDAHPRRSRRRTLYQVEIKNWAADAIGGRELPLDADEGVLRKYHIERWRAHWDKDRRRFRYPNVGKVLEEMRIPPHMDDEAGRSIALPQQLRVEPMICFWWAVHPRGKNKSLFRYRLPRQVNGFKHFWVFSMSNYLRSLGETEIELEMPSAARRIWWLKQIFTR